MFFILVSLKQILYNDSSTSLQFRELQGAAFCPDIHWFVLVFMNLCVREDRMIHRDSTDTLIVNTTGWNKLELSLSTHYFSYFLLAFSSPSDLHSLCVFGCLYTVIQWLIPHKFLYLVFFSFVSTCLLSSGWIMLFISLLVILVMYLRCFRDIRRCGVQVLLGL